MPEFLQGIEPWALFVQAIGVVAAVWGVLSFQQKTQRGILIFQLIKHALWMTHFLLLGAFAGCFLNGISMFRCLIFYLANKYKWADHKAWHGVFVVLILIATAFSWIRGEGPMALLPMGGTLVSTYSLSQRDPFRVRAVTFFVSPFWLTYNIINFSIPGILTEIISMASIIIGIIRLDLPRMRKKEPKK